MTIEGILEFGVLAVVLSSAWIVFVIAVRIGVSRWLGARWAYYLWLVPLVGLLAMGIPSQMAQHLFNVPGIEVPVVHRVIEMTAGAIGQVEKLLNDLGAIVSPDVPNEGQSAVLELLLITWVLGVWLSLLFFAARSYRFAAKMRRSSQTLNRQQQSLVQRRYTGLTESVAEIRLLAAERGPAVAGLFHPVLLLPFDFFDRYSTQQQVLILEHEFQHLRRHDLICILLARIYRCLFWFNPLVYIAERYLQLDQELSCDEKVLSGQGRNTRRIYGETLLLSAHAQVVLPQVSYSPSYGQIRQRTSMLRHHNKRILGSLLGSFLLVIAAAASIAYGVLGALELEPNLEIREGLRRPMAEILETLETGVFDDSALSTMLARLELLERAFPEQALSDYESAQLSNLFAFVHHQKGEFDRSLTRHKKVVALTDETPVLQARSLYSISEIQFARGKYVESLLALAQWEDTIDHTPSAESMALRSHAFTKLKRWDQGLRYISLAIDQAEASDQTPQKQWLLSQTALKWKLGDLEGAARSLERSIEVFPETPYGHTLAAFNALVQESWEPLSDENSLVQF